ncbi:peptide deformylase [Streptomyces melanogenes]|uniref:peptide deformylase n=1 Tax=Streptomyces melanogenes TaxID=67326 RepID=UPI00167E32A9|nr:peptide deformylase [Streptomyces melanogenes]GGP85799.1 peptide deformylase 3 [Streptomyces melanogenes]
MSAARHARDRARAAQVPRGTRRPLAEFGDPALRRPCADVTEFATEALSRLIDDMFATMCEVRGDTLAANQVGADANVFVYDCVDDEGVRHTGHLCVPVLDTALIPGVPPILRQEGCLSLPGTCHDLLRAARTVVRGRDKDGNQVVVEGTGHFARRLQHTSDHLAGTLYLDRLTREQRAEVLRQLARWRESRSPHAER